MTRPAVSVVMPFAGDAVQARTALSGLRALRLRPGDELILSDNSGTAPPAPGITIVRARGEHSPAHARNAGAEHARGEWILFLDADCDAPPDLLEAYFAHPPAQDVGAVAGEVVAQTGPDTLAARYGAQRNFLSQSAHLAHPFRPRAAAANLLVRRAAFTQLGGFLEGLRAAEDTDFSWRLQEAGWRLELCPGAAVSHRYRSSVTQLRRQWRGYAAGRAWLGRRYPGFVPEPALRRALRRVPALVRSRDKAALTTAAATGTRAAAASDATGPGASAPGVTGPGATAAPARGAGPGAPPPGRLERAEYLALDAVLALEELAGFALSNRPGPPAAQPGRQAVLIAERFPAAGDPLVELARALGQVRVEAAGRPAQLHLAAARELAIAYREDDGAAQRITATVALAVAHPARVARDLLGRAPGQPPLRALAPAVRRLRRDPGSRVLALGGAQARATAQRIARMAGRALDEAPAGAQPDPARGGRSG